MLCPHRRDGLGNRLAGNRVSEGLLASSLRLETQHGVPETRRKSSIRRTPVPNENRLGTVRTIDHRRANGPGGYPSLPRLCRTAAFWEVAARAETRILSGTRPV